MLLYCQSFVVFFLCTRLEVVSDKRPFLVVRLHFFNLYLRSYFNRKTENIWLRAENELSIENERTEIGISWKTENDWVLLIMYIRQTIMRYSSELLIALIFLFFRLHSFLLPSYLLTNKRIASPYIVIKKLIPSADYICNYGLIEISYPYEWSCRQL